MKTISYCRYLLQAVVTAFLVLGIANFPGASDDVRPILHFDAEYRERRAVPLSVAVTGDGKEVGRFSGVFGPVWSPHGDEFAFVDDALKIVALDGKHRKIIERRHLKTSGEEFHHWHPTWSPDGRRLAVITLVPRRTVGETEWKGRKGVGSLLLTRRATSR